MHELSIADAIVRIAARHAAGRRVTRVHVKVGHLRQVVPDALAFGFELLASGSELEGAELVLQEVAAAVACGACGAEGEVDAFPLACPTCGSLDTEVVRGEELLVEELELDEAEAAA